MAEHLPVHLPCLYRKIFYFSNNRDASGSFLSAKLSVLRNHIKKPLSQCKPSRVLMSLPL